MRQNLGQHFLIDSRGLFKIATAIRPQKGDVIIEIGAGHGELTGKILEIAPEAKLYLLERDPALAGFLKQNYENARVKVVPGNATETLPQIYKKIKKNKTRRGPVKIIGNVPYYLTGRLFKIASELAPRPNLLIFTIQKEVAQRIVASPPKTNLLAASIQIWAEAKIIGYLSRNSFNPPPEVDSAIIRLEPRGEKIPLDYYDLVKKLFRQPRKTILNNIREGYDLERGVAEKLLAQTGINPLDRPQNLDIAHIKSLSSAVKNLKLV